MKVIVCKLCIVYSFPKMYKCVWIKYWSANLTLRHRNISLHIGMLYIIIHIKFVCLCVDCLTSQQHASVSQGRICSDNFTCCHNEIEAADQTFHLTQSQCTNIEPTSSVLTLYRQAPGRVATGVPIFKSLVWLDPGKIPAQAGFKSGIFCSRGRRLNH